MFYVFLFIFCDRQYGTFKVHADNRPPILQGLKCLYAHYKKYLIFQDHIIHSNNNDMMFLDPDIVLSPPPNPPKKLPPRGKNTDNYFSARTRVWVVSVEKKVNKCLDYEIYRYKGDLRWMNLCFSWSREE